jgi:hypothetical protein
VNPAADAGENPEPDPAPVRAYTVAELAAIAAKLSKAYESLPDFGAATGLRPEEWADAAIVPGGKTKGSVREVPLTGRALAALDRHRAELAELVARQVDVELERLAGELVAETLARRNGAQPVPARHANGDGEAAATVEAAATAELKRCSTCGQLRPRAEYGPDRRTADGLRARCRECRQRREYPLEAAARRARRAREKPRRAAQVSASDDDEPRPDPRAVESGRAAHIDSHGERVPSVDEWLVSSGFATLEHGRLVPTAAGLEVGAALDAEAGES